MLATLAGGDPFLMVDLAVYVDGARHLTDGTLYDFFSEPLHLPFTYPTFSAIIFTPMTWLPWTLLRVLWQLASFGAIGLMAYCDAAVARPGRAEGAEPARSTSAGIVVTITALGLWLEPVRTTFNYGQINLFLCALLLAGAVAGKEWMAGASVGLAAGIKLTPAITGLYYLLQKRWSAVVWSIVFFALTVAVGAGPAAQRDVAVLHQADARPGPHRAGVVGDQPVPAWRDRPDRRRGPDLGLAGLRRRWPPCSGSGRPGCACGPVTGQPALLAVQFTGLLISPISWSHHWVWVLPLLLWCLFGPRQRLVAVRVLAIAWVVATCSYIVSILIAQQYIDQPASRPGWQSGLGAIYPVLGVLTLVLLGVVSLRARRSPGPRARPADPGLPRRRRLLRDTGVRCAGLRAGHEVLDRRT